VVHYDIHSVSLNHQGEELCGDQVKVVRSPDKTLVVLSDGLGSGVKANILARLTAEILVTMLRERVPLKDVLETVVGTLPTCKVRQIAYAAFVVVEIEQATGRFQVINFDCPPPFLLRAGKLVRIEPRVETILGRELRLSGGTLERGDFLGIISDGVLYAGMGVTMNFGWGWEQIGDYLEQIASSRPASASAVVRRLMEKTNSLYSGQPGDDATLAGVLAREPHRLMVFTGPPTDKNLDEQCVERLLHFEGRKVVCGGTTGNIVANHLGETVDLDLTTLREDVPPIGSLPHIDLMTEGILTLARTLRLLKESHGDASRVMLDRNGASLFARELLRADSILFLAGEQVNPFYQNPLLPRNISIRHNLIEQVAEVLTGFHKTVQIEWC
jgi:hypothetical protein